MTRNRWVLVGVAVAAAVVAAVLLTRQDDTIKGGGAERIFNGALTDPVPYDGRSPALTPGRSERVLIELPRPALGAKHITKPKAQKRYVGSLKDEATALISALRARGVKLKGVVTFERCFHGFAATLKTKDQAQLASLGVRVRANRRFFPAFSQPIPAQGPPVAQPPATAPEVTLLAGGVPASTGYDTVDHDKAPYPGTDIRDPQRREVGGEPLANELESLGARVTVIRVSGLREGEEYGRTDELLEGLERTVDPNLDGDTSDHAKVALIGVSAPYAGFADAPESIAVRGAKRLGTTIIAPAGDEGPATGAYGTIGSPGASTGALAVAPQTNPQAVAHTTLRVGNTTVTNAAVLAGTPPNGAMTTARPVAANTTAALLVANEQLTDRLAIVEAGSNPGARAAAAAGAGAAAVVIAEPRTDHPLPALPAGRVDVPVIGVTGKAAEAILALRAGTTAEATGLRAPKGPFQTGQPSRFASVGPAYSGTTKPDLTRPGTVVVNGELITGAAVAAARVAVDAAKGINVEPAPDTAVPTPVPPPQIQIGPLAVTENRSVQFTVGTFNRGDPAGNHGSTVVPAARLELLLTKPGSATPVESLTPPGGERGVMPGAYAYTLPKAIVKRLGKGTYSFRVEAQAPRQTTPTTAVSAPFSLK